MTELTRERLLELEGLERAATHGPLDIERRDDDCGYMNYIVHGGKGDFAWCRDELDSKARHNADLIAALVNSAPELLAAARRALELESALAFLRSYKADNYKGHPPETPEHYVTLAKALGWAPTSRSENG